ncbi:class IV adenylate cyclase [Candidatus Uhrbacteria bacterium]|nr:class IV adenylate cyclase [Candidatus Uhrbacteria bacterium]
MREIEVKILEIDRRALEAKLRALGAKKTFDGPVDVRMYDTLRGELKKRGIIFRLRKKGASGELTVKTDFKRTLRAKTSAEYETNVDFIATQKMLKVLGYAESFRMKKRRIEYVIGSVHFEIDKISGIPWFLEIEAPSEKQLMIWIKKLGYKPSDAKSWWWHEVLGHYGHSYKQQR